MTAFTRILALVLSLVCPPVSCYLMRGFGLWTWVSLALFVLAHVVFWGFAAAPGLAIMVLAVLQAVILCLLPIRRKKAVLT